MQRATKRVERMLDDDVGLQDIEMYIESASTCPKARGARCSSWRGRRGIGTSADAQSATSWLERPTTWARSDRAGCGRDSSSACDRTAWTRPTMSTRRWRNTRWTE